MKQPKKKKKNKLRLSFYTRMGHICLCFWDGPYAIEKNVVCLQLAANYKTFKSVNLESRNLFCMNNKLLFGLMNWFIFWGMVFVGRVFFWCPFLRIFLPRG